MTSRFQIYIRLSKSGLRFLNETTKTVAKWPLNDVPAALPFPSGWTSDLPIARECVGSRERREGRGSVKFRYHARIYNCPEAPHERTELLDKIHRQASLFGIKFAMKTAYFADE